jgi:hypothetical protein
LPGQKPGYIEHYPEIKHISAPGFDEELSE